MCRTTSSPTRMPNRFRTEAGITTRPFSLTRMRVFNFMSFLPALHYCTRCHSRLEMTASRIQQVRRRQMLRHGTKKPHPENRRDAAPRGRCSELRRGHPPFVDGLGNALSGSRVFLLDVFDNSEKVFNSGG